MTIGIGKRSILSCVFLLIIQLFFSCTGSRPSFVSADLKWVYESEVNLLENNFTKINKKAWFLSAFVELTDRDGLEDIEELYFINDGNQLFWSLNRSNWTSPRQGRIGSNRLELPWDERLPGGSLRIQVWDRAGEMDEGKVSLPSTNRVLDLENLLDSLSFKKESSGFVLRSSNMDFFQDYSFNLSVSYVDDQVQILRAEPKIEKLDDFTYRFTIQEQLAVPLETVELMAQNKRQGAQILIVLLEY